MVLKVLLAVLMSVCLVACVSTTSTNIDSNIRSYDYARFMTLKHIYPVSAFKTEIEDEDAKTKQTGLTLHYKDEDNIENELYISSAYFTDVRQVLIAKLGVTDSIRDKVNLVQVNDEQVVEVVADYAWDELIISIGSQDGFFTFKARDIEEILHLFNQLRQE